MAYNTKDLKDLEYSIYALQSKASNINEQINDLNNNICYWNYQWCALF